MELENNWRKQNYNGLNLVNVTLEKWIIAIFCTVQITTFTDFLLFYFAFEVLVDYEALPLVLSKKKAYP